MADQLSDELKLHVEQATVRLPRRICRGVLVPGGFIVTAAHCLACEEIWDIMRGDSYLESIETGTGSLKASPVFLEVIADVAVLEAPDAQESFDEHAAYIQWCEAAPGVPIYEDNLPLQQPVPVAIFTQRGWVDGQICLYNPFSSRVMLEPQGPLQVGVSGSPVVTLDGRLVGVASAHRPKSDENGPLEEGGMPWLTQVLPVGLLRRMSSE